MATKYFTQATVSLTGFKVCVCARVLCLELGHKVATSTQLKSYQRDQTFAYSNLGSLITITGSKKVTKEGN